MRIAILSDAIFPYHHGGKERVTFEQSTRLTRLGHQVRLHTMHWWPERDPEITRDGVFLHAIAPKFELYTRRGRRSILEAVAFGLASLRLLWSEPFDVLWTDQFPYLQIPVARFVCSLRRRPLILTWYEVWDRAYWRQYLGWLGTVGVLLQRFTLRHADFIVTISELTAQRLRRELGIDPARILVVPPCGIESLESGSPPTPVPPAIDCIFVGRLLGHKHVDVLLQAVASLPGVTALVIGSGPERPRLEELSRSLGLASRVRFEAPADHATVLSRLRSARLFVFPSTREGFGIAVWEANACGLPAVVVRHPDNAALELVSPGENGFVCELDPKAMAAAIRSFLADPELQNRMRAASRRAAARYSWEVNVSKIEGALEHLTDTAPRLAA